jgi:serine/threonine protein kinase
VLGTPYYMSPEQISGSMQLDYQTDLWAVAVIATRPQRASPKKQHRSSSRFGLTRRALSLRPRPVPRDFDAWFDRAMEREPRAASARRELATSSDVCAIRLSSEPRARATVRAAVRRRIRIPSPRGSSLCRTRHPSSPAPCPLDGGLSESVSLPRSSSQRGPRRISSRSRSPPPRRRPRRRFSGTPGPPRSRPLRPRSARRRAAPRSALRGGPRRWTRELPQHCRSTRRQRPQLGRRCRPSGTPLHCG